MTSNTYEVPADVQIALVNQELQMHHNTIYILSVRHRVNKKLGNEEAAKANVKEIEDHEKAVDELKIVLDESKQSIANGKVTT